MYVQKRSARHVAAIVHAAAVAATPQRGSSGGSRALDLGRFRSRSGGHVVARYAPRERAACRSINQLGDRPSSLVRGGLALTPAEPRVMSARMPLAKGSSSSSSSRDCETLLIVLRSCLGATLGPSPPVATVEMDKGEGLCGNGGKGKKGTRWPREEGSYAYLKNFRRGLLHQRKRALRDMQADEDDKKARPSAVGCGSSRSSIS